MLCPPISQPHTNNCTKKGIGFNYILTVNFVLNNNY